MAKVLAWKCPFCAKYFKDGDARLVGAGSPPTSPGPKHSGRVPMLAEWVDEKQCAKPGESFGHQHGPPAA